MLLLLGVVCFALLVIVIWFYYPLLKPRRSALPVLLISSLQTDSVSSPKAFSVFRLEKLMKFLSSHHFQAITTTDITTPPNNLSRPVLLLFAGGYQSFYTFVFPLLKKYNLKAVIALPVGLIGKYNAWLPADKGPWQNILTATQIKELKKSGLVDFISGGLSGNPLTSAQESANTFELTESKHRLHQMYRIHTHSFLFPPCAFISSQTRQQAAEIYSLLFTPQTGLNDWPLKAPFLKTYPLQSRTCLSRLFFKLRRL